MIFDIILKEVIMRHSSTYKLLFLLNLLSSGEFTKNEILEKFKENNISITKSLITNYINQIINNDIKLNIKINSKREKVYSLQEKKTSLDFNQSELKLIFFLKKLLISQKNPTRIRRTMRMFYKLACLIEDEDICRQFIDFGYYSTLHWNLVRQLEEHCKKKNIITIDYILPQGGNKELTLHVDKIKSSNWSEKLYLQGVFKHSKQFSHLPIDRIFQVKKLERQCVRFNLVTKNLEYIVDLKTYESLAKDKKEKIIEIKNNRVKIQRPIDDIFYIIQRLLCFCPDVYYISDENIKNMYKEKLELLKTNYEKTIDK